MAYTINLTDGTVFATINDGTINQIASGTPSVPLVTLVGKNYAGYGEFLDENFVHLLESGSNTIAPTSPLTGQLWWDKTNNIMKVYSGTGFKTITGSTSSASEPTTTVIAGDLWFDSSNQQLKVYTGAAWLVVGPGYTSAQGTSGAIPETILNNVGATKYITSLYVNNVRVGVVFDGASFTPQASLQAAFPTIYPGMTLSASVSGAVFAGSATNAQLLDSLDSSQFMRTDAATSTTGILRVQNNTGMFVGVSNVFNVNTTSTDANIKSNISGGNLIIQANVAGTTYNVAQALGGNGTFAVSNAATVGTTLSVTGNTTGGNLITGGLITATGNITGGNVNTVLVAATTLSATANVQGGNLRTTGLISATGNITSLANVSGSYILGNGSQLSGLSLGVSVTKFTNGLTEGNIGAVDGNINFNVAGTSNVLVLTTSSAYFSGNANVTGIEKGGSNIVGNIGAVTGGWFNQAFVQVVNSTTISAGGNVTGGNLITAGAISAASVSASGNITGGNVNTVLVSATANVQGGNLRTGGLISATGNITGGNLSVGTGTVTVGNIVNSNAGNAVGNIGSSTNYFNTVFALATSAQYADLAERYAADAVLEPGTVVDLGGSHEITQSQQDLSDAVFGVISTSAAYMMNSGAGDNNTHPPVAIVGRVPTKVLGIVRKGDRLVSAGNGCARAAQPGEATWLNVIGRSLENKDSDGLGTIEATVSVK